MEIIIPFTKIDEAQRLVYGIATAERPDKAGEIMDYDSSVSHYKLWSGEIEKASDGKSVGNLREMHSNIAAGKLTQIIYNDAEKSIEICGKVVDDSSWNKVLEGVLVGFSQGGEYIKRWKDKETGLTRYTARPSEVSLVDNPCLPEAVIEVIKADGTTEMRKLMKEAEPQEEPEQGWKAKDGSFHKSKSAALKHNKALDTKAVSSPAMDAIKKATEMLDSEPTEKPDVEPEKLEKTLAPIDLKKGMYWIGRMAEILSSVQYLAQDAQYEAISEGDGSQLPAKMMEWLKAGGALLVEAVAEEVAEMTVAADMGPVMAMAASLSPDAAALVKSHIVMDTKGDLTKALDTAIEKKGAILSAKSKTMLDKMHKSACDHMGTMEDCMKGLGMMMDEEDDAEKVAKVATSEELTELREQNDLLKTELQTVNEAVKTLVKKVETFVNSPAPYKPRATMVVKGHEVEKPVEEPVARDVPNGMAPATARASGGYGRA